MIYRLNTEQQRDLLAQSEFGMGYQLSRDGDFVFINAEIALSVEIAKLTTIGDHLPWLEGFVHEVDDDTRAELLCELEQYSASLEVVEHGSYSSTTRVDEIFFRYSAFRRDRRINSADGSVLPGTYATTESDSALVPSGLAAVGRYALPLPLPAIYAYQLSPPPATRIHCGNSAPAFGQAGGGVEIFFNTGCPAASATLPPSTIRDR